MADLRAAAQAVLDRWDSPKWEWAKHGPTADLMAELRAALAQAEPVQSRADAMQEMVRGAEVAGLYELTAEPVQAVEATEDRRCPHGIRHPHPCRECEDGEQQAEPVQRKPLTEEEIEMEWSLTPQDEKREGVYFARRIERAHGIKDAK